MQSLVGFDGGKGTISLQANLLGFDFVHRHSYCNLRVISWISCRFEMGETPYSLKEGVIFFRLSPKISS
jgi:hypothetical protein